MSNIFTDSESLGENNVKKQSQICKLLLIKDVKLPRKKSFFFWQILSYQQDFLALVLITALVQRFFVLCMWDFYYSKRNYALCTEITCFTFPMENNFLIFLNFLGETQISNLFADTTLFAVLNNNLQVPLSTEMTFFLLFLWKHKFSLFLSTEITLFTTPYEQK